MKHKLESRLQGEISITTDMQITPSLWQKAKGTKEPLDEGEREWKSCLETPHSKTKIMKSSPITSWHIDGETMEAVKDFIFLGPKITVEGDCSHEIKRRLFLGRKAMTNLDSVLKKQRHYFAYKGLYSQSYGFSSSHVQMWELDNKNGWTPKNWCFRTTVKEDRREYLETTGRSNQSILKDINPEYSLEGLLLKLKFQYSGQLMWRTDAFELWCWRRLLRVPWTARRSNQSILKEISPEYSLEGLLLKLKFQYFGHLMQRADSSEKTLMLGKIEDKLRRGWQRIRQITSPTQWRWIWANSGR